MEKRLEEAIRYSQRAREEYDQLVNIMFGQFPEFDDSVNVYDHEQIMAALRKAGYEYRKMYFADPPATVKFVDDNGVEGELDYEPGDPSVGIPSGYAFAGIIHPFSEEDEDEDEDSVAEEMTKEELDELPPDPPEDESELLTEDLPPPPDQG